MMQGTDTVYKRPYSDIPTEHGDLYGTVVLRALLVSLPTELFNVGRWGSLR